MELILPNGKVLRGDLVPLVIKRTDLTGNSSTLECLIRVDKDLSEFIQQGNILSLAEKEIGYRIIATSKQGDGIRTQGNPDYMLTKVIAILDSCHKSLLLKNVQLSKKIPISVRFIVLVVQPLRYPKILRYSVFLVM